MSHRPQRARRGRLIAGRDAAIATALAACTAAGFAIWPANGGVGAGRSAEAAARPSSSAASRATARSHPSVEAPEARSRPVRRPPTGRSQGRPAKARVADGQLVTVTAPTRRSTAAVVQRWVHRAGSWVRVGVAMHARIGAAGLTRHPSEKLAATPIGSFTLTQAFGAAPNTGHRVTELRYIHIRYGDTWGARPNRPTYNRYYNCHCRGATLFALRHSLFRYGVVIDYNRWPVVPGAGSGFFLHVTNGRPTGGCVTVAARNVRTLLGWLRPDLHPRIWIRAAYR